MSYKKHAIIHDHTAVANQRHELHTKVCRLLKITRENAFKGDGIKVYHGAGERAIFSSVAEPPTFSRTWHEPWRNLPDIPKSAAEHLCALKRQRRFTVGGMHFMVRKSDGMISVSEIVPVHLQDRLVELRDRIVPNAGKDDIRQIAKELDNHERTLRGRLPSWKFKPEPEGLQ